MDIRLKPQDLVSVLSMARNETLLGFNVGRKLNCILEFSVYANFSPEWTHDQKSENGIWTKNNSYIKDINEKAAVKQQDA